MSRHLDRWLTCLYRAVAGAAVLTLCGVAGYKAGDGRGPEAVLAALDHPPARAVACAGSKAGPSAPAPEAPRGSAQLLGNRDVPRP